MYFAIPDKKDENFDLIMSILSDALKLSTKYMKNNQFLSSKQWCSVLTDAANKHKVFIDNNDMEKIIKQKYKDFKNINLTKLIIDAIEFTLERKN